MEDGDGEASVGCRGNSIFGIGVCSPRWLLLIRSCGDVNWGIDSGCGLDVD